jgi:tetratricopeptide (TPR) repeat protein
MGSANEQILKTSKGHQWLTLIGATFVLFEIVFIGFYSNNFWFSLNLSWLGIPTILLVFALAYFVVKFLASPAGCKLASPIWRGKPPVVFEQWLRIDDDGFTYGLRHVRWDVIEGVALTLFGNLEVRSRAICGDAQKAPDVIFKFPFAPAAQPQQQQFIEALQSQRVGVEINERLQKKLTSPIVKGQNFVQALGGAMMMVLLFDLGYSSFYYLEMLKHYYLADVAALAKDGANVDAELRAGDQLREHPLPVSWITNRFLTVGSCAAGVSAARADALWHAGRSEEALGEAHKAIGFTPEHFREYLHYARFLESRGDLRGAHEQIELAVEKHKIGLLPRLYRLANAHDEKPATAVAVYKQQLDDLNEKVFGEQPVWPPGGERYVIDGLYLSDMEFILDRLIGTKTSDH